MKSLFQYLLFMPFIGIVCSCSSDKKPTIQEQPIDSIAEAYFQDELRLSPVLASTIGDSRYDSIYYNDLTVSYRAKNKAFYLKYEQILSNADTTQYNPNQYLTFVLLRREIKLALEGMQFHDEYMPMDQLNGNIWMFAQMGSGQSIQPFKTYQDYQNFLKRTNGFVDWCDTAIVNMRKGMKLGYAKPACVVKKTIPQLAGLISAKPEESIFYSPIRLFPATFTPAQKDSLTRLYKNVIAEKINPALHRLYEFVKNEYYPGCRPSIAITDIPNGKAYYAYMVKLNTTTNLSPDSIFNLGISEVNRIRKEMEKIKNQVGFKGDFSAFLKFVQTDRRFYPFKTGGEVIDRFNSIYNHIKPQLAKNFHLVPKSGFEVRQVEKFRETTTDAHYEMPSYDGSRKGIFYVPVPNPLDYNELTMETLFLHEAIPGHHFQLALQQEMKDLPKFRKFGGNSAYIEGWALYAETLGGELGIYTDPYQYLGHLSDEMLRAVRLVVDVGMHTKGWTREQAIAYLKSNVISTDRETEVAIERYIVWPGQALSYKIGALCIQDLRKQAEEKLGKQFNLADFHEQILKYGALPLEVLEIQIHQWIDNHSHS